MSRFVSRNVLEEDSELHGVQDAFVPDPAVAIVPPELPLALYHDLVKSILQNDKDLDIKSLIDSAISSTGQGEDLQKNEIEYLEEKLSLYLGQIMHELKDALPKKIKELKEEILEQRYHTQEDRVEENETGVNSSNPDCTSQVNAVSSQAVESEGDSSAKQEDAPAMSQAQTINYLPRCPESLGKILKEMYPGTPDELSVREVRSTLKSLTLTQILEKKEVLGEYAQQILDSKKVEEYPYVLVMLVCLKHVCDDYDELADKVYGDLEEPWASYERNRPETADYAIELYRHDVWSPKYSSFTLERWQQVYDGIYRNLSTLQKKMSTSIKKEGVVDIPIQPLNEIKLLEAFTIHSFEALKKTQETLNDLQEDIKDRKFGLLIEDARDLLELVISKIATLTSHFPEEAVLVGNVEDYFGVLNDHTQ